MHYGPTIPKAKRQKIDRVKTAVLFSFETPKPRSCTLFSALLVVKFHPHIFGVSPTLFPTHLWLLFEAGSDVRE